MSNNNNIPSYNLEHIKQYVSGNMSREEMYVFEKTMLNDSFLEDAVEGFRAANIAKANNDLATIKAQLLPQKKQAKIVLFYNEYKTVFNAAAMVILVVGIGRITYSVFNNSTTKNLAEVTIPKKEITTSNADTARIIVKNKASELTVTTNKSIYKSQSSSNQKREIAVADKAIKKEERIRQLEDNVIEKDGSKSVINRSSEPKQITAGELKNLPPVSINQLLQGRVAGMDVMKKQQKKDSSPSSLLSNTDLVNNTDNKITYNYKNLLKPDSINQQLLKEVVVIGYGTQKKYNITGSVSLIDDNSLKPIGGWEAFNAYFNKQLVNLIDPLTNKRWVLKDRSGNKIDTLNIQLFVNKKQYTYKVKMITPIDNRTRNAITDIIKKGPKWLAPKRKNKAKIVIKNIDK
ncbi:MAG: hypothetical protein H7068_05805 [Pedobacter sp.]|nr:hypothetical protein [Chitinophagaceae bacterium]